jgi:hypothetical protein
VIANLEETRLPGADPNNQVELPVDAFAEPFRDASPKDPVAAESHLNVGQAADGPRYSHPSAAAECGRKRSLRQPHAIRDAITNCQHDAAHGIYERRRPEQQTAAFRRQLARQHAPEVLDNVRMAGAIHVRIANTIRRANRAAL